VCPKRMAARMAGVVGLGGVLIRSVDLSGSGSAAYTHVCIGVCVKDCAPAQSAHRTALSFQGTLPLPSKKHTHSPPHSVLLSLLELLPTSDLFSIAVILPFPNVT
jgi:hypothetical protein